MINFNYLYQQSQSNIQLAFPTDYTHLPQSYNTFQQQFSPPPFSLFLGFKGDHQPYFLSLIHPDAAPILILDKRMHAASLSLKSILSTTMHINRSAGVNFQVISPRPRDFQPFTDSPSFLGVVSTRSVQARLSIHSLCDLLENCQSSDSMLIPEVLIIDSLDHLLSGYEDKDLIFDLLYLLNNGPHYCLWVIASLDPSNRSWYTDKIIGFFSSHLFGDVNHDSLSTNRVLFSIPHNPLHTGEYIFNSPQTTFPLTIPMGSDIPLAGD
ncbi:MAG: hypothetical protein JXA19_02520 [Anaerolineales bacterium]|nr:hypothetical protein [Anaerolineales bacterium]